MDEYYDDDFTEDQIKEKRKSKERNPKGPYEVDLKYKGIEFQVIIENVTFDKFKIAIYTDNEEIPEKHLEEVIESLKKYIELEGFFLAARKWNIFY